MRVRVSDNHDAHPHGRHSKKHSVLKLKVPIHATAEHMKIERDARYRDQFEPGISGTRKKRPEHGFRAFYASYTAKFGGCSRLIFFVQQVLELKNQFRT